MRRALVPLSLLLLAACDAPPGPAGQVERFRVPPGMERISFRRPLKREPLLSSPMTPALDCWRSPPTFQYPSSLWTRPATWWGLCPR